MTKSETKNLQRTAWRSFGSRYGVAAIAASAVLLAPMASAWGSTTPMLKSANVAGFPGALVNHSSRSLYVLSVEKGAKIKCTAACTPTWPPLLVKSSVTTVSLGAGVKGKIGFVKRSKTMKQVTFNSFPVYTYSGDSGMLQSNGQGITADGGIWTLVKAKASSANTTAYSKSVSSGTTTTTSGGGYGY
jgi:predicted lipoprotein with Yx(FWY)xxD motif